MDTVNVPPFVQESIQTLLRYYIETCDLCAVQCLLDRGADVSHQYEDNTTPLFIACGVKKKCYDLFKLLLEKGADCNYPDRKLTTPYLKAVSALPLKVVRLFIDHGAEITKVDSNGLGPLHYAVMNPYTGVLELVLDQGFGVDDNFNTCINSPSPLHIAALFANFRGCELLLRRGATVNKLNAHGFRPLQAAVTSVFPKFNGDEPKVIQLLLDYGADVTRDILRDAASQKANADMRNVLTRHMAKLQSSNSSIMLQRMLWILFARTGTHESGQVLPYCVHL